ncbi:hypothetical protein MKW94_029110 [Papaver nudicaule]|uniref:Endoglucanase n=1 Tax=Papaver nudicaule TaxID=74823 RepID=A0AA41S686_PAPNU|nr:hypothetical protein [Papaver nudicaule]
MMKNKKFPQQLQVIDEEEEFVDEEQRIVEMKSQWRLRKQKINKRTFNVNFRCGVCVCVVLLVILVPTILIKNWPTAKFHPPPPDEYTIALKKALQFFDAQKSGRLPKNNPISWRNDSGLGDLEGGYYDSGGNMKISFPMAFSMSILSWSVIEYRHKYKSVGEYDHIRDIIKWGTDYLLRTFNSSTGTIDLIYSQVGVDDRRCWQRPEDVEYSHTGQKVYRGPDLGSEMAAALASASIVFADDKIYSKKLIKGATALFEFAMDDNKRPSTPSSSKTNKDIAKLYRSSDYHDEYIWAAAWMYYATGNSVYLSIATDPGIPKQAKALHLTAELSALSWDNKFPAAELLLTRLRVFLRPGYPYEGMLKCYHNLNDRNMCSYLEKFNVYNFTKGGLILMNRAGFKNLQYAANAAFIAALYFDYMKAMGVPGWYCGPQYIDADDLYKFATSQVHYILGANPRNLSYVVGYGEKYPKHVHHRGASIPKDGHIYNCTEGLRWRDTHNSNPNNVTGAMVSGPDRFDGFIDVRTNYSYTEPTLAGNAGLVAALVSLTTSGGSVIDKNTMFSGVPPDYPVSPSPPPPWKP